jgi:hypothetical protein
MIEALIFDNLTYISMADAIAGSNLSSEYLARLARTGRLRGRIVAHMWFIEMHSLQQFLCARNTKEQREQFVHPAAGSY